MINMLNRLNKQNKETGFTLAELLVVIAILGILAAIALPIFLSQREAASKATVKSDANNTAISVASYISSNPTLTSFPESVKVVSANNLVKISGGAYDYIVCVGNPEYPAFTWGFNSITGQFSEGCDITGGTDGKLLPPAAPTGLSLTASSNTVEASWTPSPGATGYNLYKDGVLVATVTDNKYVYTGLTEGAVYDLTVEAVNSVGSGSSAIVATTKAAVPPALDLSSTPNSITAVWNASVGATGYKLYQNGVYVTTITDLTYVYTNLTPDTEYTMAVSAVNSVGESDKTVAVKRTGIFAPDAPTGFILTASYNNVSAVWDATPSAISYRVYKDGLYVATVSEPAYVYNGLQGGTSYVLGVSAVNAGGESNHTTQVKVTTVAIPTIPIISTTTINPTNVQLSWNAQAGVSVYKVFQNGIQVGTTSGTSYNFTGLSQNTSYILEVSASNASGESAKASKTAVTTISLNGFTPYRTTATTFNAQVIIGTTAGSMQVWVYNQTYGASFSVNIANGKIVSQSTAASISGNTITFYNMPATAGSNWIPAAVYNSVGQGIGWGNGFY